MHASADQPGRRRLQKGRFDNGDPVVKVLCLRKTSEHNFWSALWPNLGSILSCRVAELDLRRGWATENQEKPFNGTEHKDCVLQTVASILVGLQSKHRVRSFAWKASKTMLREIFQSKSGEGSTSKPSAFGIWLELLRENTHEQTTFALYNRFQHISTPFLPTTYVVASPRF